MHLSLGLGSLDLITSPKSTHESMLTEGAHVLSTMSYARHARDHAIKFVQRRSHLAKNSAVRQAVREVDDERGNNGGRRLVKWATGRDSDIMAR